MATRIRQTSKWTRLKVIQYLRERREEKTEQAPGDPPPVVPDPDPPPPNR